MARGSGGVQSVHRALDVLEAMQFSDRGVGISELARELDLPETTIHRLMSTLLRRGYVRQDPVTRKYLLGPCLIPLGSAAGSVLGTKIQPYLERAVELTGETANLAVLDGSEVLYVAQAASPHKVRTFTEVGSWVLPHNAAVGKVLLAYQPPAVAERLLRRNGLPTATSKTITDLDRMMEELEEVRRRGFALDLEERVDGVSCVAVPLWGWDRPLAAISVSGPTSRMSATSFEEVAETLAEVASQASEAFTGERATTPDRPAASAVERKA